VPAERIVITRAGGPEVLRCETYDPPPPARGEVAIEVRAVGVNFADLFCRLGLYRAAPPIPFVPGFEVAGEVAAVGEGVEQPAPGDPVLALTRFGGYASRVNVGAAWVRPLLPGWGFAQGAAFPVVFLTAWHGLVHVGRLAAGERVVVQSAAGGVGTAACQIARALGASVIGTVGAAWKEEVARAAGAGEVIVTRDYGRKVWAGVARLTERKGVDLVLDAVGGCGLRGAYRALRPAGRLVVYGFAELMPRGGLRNWPLLAWRFLRTPRFSPLALTADNRTVAGFNLVELWDRADLFAEAWSRLEDLARRGSLRPVVGATFPFERAGEAHAFLQSRRSAGKVVLIR
jgi:NADPH:quinone reductase-like Zn-dependent oxidoreductase